MPQAWTARMGKRPRDWAAWFDGKTRVIRRGVDFDCKAKSMLVQLRMRASEHGGRITGNVEKGDPDKGEPDSVCFRFVKLKKPATKVATPKRRRAAT